MELFFGFAARQSLPLSIARQLEQARNEEITNGYAGVNNGQKDVAYVLLETTVMDMDNIRGTSLQMVYQDGSADFPG